MADDIQTWIDIISKTVAFIAVAIGALGGLWQYRINSKAEARMRDLAVLETDIKISRLFSELISTANGFGPWSDPQPDVIKEIFKNVPEDLMKQMIMTDPRNVHKLVEGSKVSTPIPLSAEIAASEAIANLAIKYPFLLEPALAGLDVVAGFLPQARNAYMRLSKYYGIDRPLTKWGPDWGLKKQPKDWVKGTQPYQEKDEGS